MSPFIDPLIEALIWKLPPPNSAWPGEKRQIWLRAMEGAISLAYPIEAGAEKPVAADGEKG